MSNKDVGTKYKDPFEWVDLAFETMMKTIVFPLLFVMLGAFLVIGYVFKSIMRAFSSKAADLT